MEDLVEDCLDFSELDLMEDPLDFSELDDLLASIEAPMYHDFLAVETLTSRADSPAWFCARIGCNGEHDHIYFEELERTFENLVIEPRNPSFQHRKALKMDNARPSTRHGRPATVKPIATMRDRSVPAKALLPKKKDDARVAQGKTGRLGLDKQTTSNPKCQKEKPVAKIHKEVSKVASSRHPLQTLSLISKRNTASSATQGIKTIQANVCSQGKKSEIAWCTDVVRSEARAAQSRNVQFAGKLIATLPQSQKKECRKEKLCEHLHEDVVKVAPLRQYFKSQSKMPERNAKIYSHHQEEVIDNVTCSQEKDGHLRKETVKVVPYNQIGKKASKALSDAKLDQGKTQRPGLDKQTTSNPKCQKEKPVAKTHKEVLKVASSRHPLQTSRFQTSSLISKRNTASSATRGIKTIQANVCSQGKKSEIAWCSDVVRFLIQNFGILIDE